jgi:nitroreductase
MRFSAKYLICFLLGEALHAADSDRAIEQVMRRAAPDVHHVRVLQRVSLESQLDLVIALGTPPDRRPGRGGGDWWNDKTTLGLLLQQRDQPSLIYRIAVEKGSADADCYAMVERATTKNVVLSCTPEAGRPGPNRKFIYDVRAKALIKRIDYDPFTMHRVFVSSERAVLVGSDYRRLMAVEYSPSRVPPFRVLEGAEERQWTHRVPTTTGTVGTGAQFRQEIYIAPEPFKPVHFGGGRYTLAQEEKESLIVLEQGRHGVKRIPLPQASYEEFAAARPRRVKDGYVASSTQIQEQIGPWQVAEGTVWFGKSFYDGEGITGVGGFGYFDHANGKYHLYSPPEIADWSVTAILVEPDAVWLALARHGEGTGTAGGLLRFDRATEKVEKFNLPDVVGKIARIGDRLLLATEFGAAVVEENKIRRFFVDQMSEGRLQVVEANIGRNDLP